MQKNKKRVNKGHNFRKRRLFVDNILKLCYNFNKIKGLLANFSKSIRGFYAKDYN